MSLKTLLMPHLINWLTSNTLTRFKRGLFLLHKKFNPSIDQITFYLRVNDPYSYLLLQVLPDLLISQQKQLNIKILLQLNSDLNLEIDKQANYALKDAKRLAIEHQLSFPQKTQLPSLQNSQLATAILLANLNHPEFLQLCQLVCDALWLSQDTTLSLDKLTLQYGKLSPLEAEQQLNHAKHYLQQKGHYQSGMLYYGGEWYWGIDRLWHLYQRLSITCTVTNILTETAIATKTAKKEAAKEISLPGYLQRNTACMPLDKHDGAEPPSIDFYFSFRSPYSYLAAQRLFKIAQKYPLTINIKPVLPMVMRGLKVPKNKRLYIVHDAKREAERYQIAFGKIADPLGEGVERCMALFYFAKQQAKEKQLVDAISQGIWAEGIDTASDKGLRRLVCRAGLDWGQAKKCLAEQDWKVQAEKNQRDLNQLGLWGVPSFQYQGLAFWGQDRLAAIIKEITQRSSK